MWLQTENCKMWAVKISSGAQTITNQAKAQFLKYEYILKTE